MQVEFSQLQKIAPRATLESFVGLNEAMAEFGIDTPLRAAMFLGQLSEECIEFTTFREIWGPSKDQLRYERPMLADGSLAPKVNPLTTKVPTWQVLGNWRRGDGKLFMGRGGIQLTGGGNYEECGTELKLALHEQPWLAELAENRYRVSGWYWRKHKLNAPSDEGDVRRATLLINGPGLYGLAQREAYYTRALAALGAVAACS
jgi:putative chitinase